VQQLEDALGAGEIAQPHRAEVAQRHPIREPVTCEVHDGARQQQLAAVGRTRDPRGPVDDAAVIIVVAALDHARVHTAADFQRHTRGCTRIVECTQDL